MKNEHEFKKVEDTKRLKKNRQKKLATKEKFELRDSNLLK